jgi:tetratricopeptide (TPR) repeat protein
VVLGLVAAAAIVALMALSAGGGPEGGGERQAAGAGAATAADGGEKGAEAPEPVQPAPEPETTEDAEPAPPEQTGTDPGTGAALNEQGYALIQAGEYEEAVPVLEQAVGSFPEGTDDLNYAYALFNLGSALRLSGRPEEAIPVLEQRLQIPNQKGHVRKELEAAYAEAGGSGSPEEGDDD